MSTRLAGWRLVALLVCALPLCARPGPVELTQADGSMLTLPGPVASIATLSPHLVELAFAAGAGSNIVATVEYSDFPEAARAIPRVGDAFRIDLEQLLAIRPGLVIAWQSGNPAAALARLEQLGFPVWRVEVRQPGAIADTLVELGSAAGSLPAANAAAREVRNVLADIAGEFDGRPPVRYFYQVSERPLFTLNDEHLISTTLAMCGGVNVFGHLPALAQAVTAESVIVANPDVLMAPRAGATEPLRQWWNWPSLKAVANGAMVLVPANEFSRATPRFVRAALAACRRLDEFRPPGNRRKEP